MDTTAADFRETYYAARLQVHAAETVTARAAAEARAERILDDADNAGVDLYLEVLDLDNAARAAVAAA